MLLSLSAYCEIDFCLSFQSQTFHESALMYIRNSTKYLAYTYVKIKENPTCTVSMWLYKHCNLKWVVESYDKDVSYKYSATSTDELKREFTIFVCIPSNEYCNAIAGNVTDNANSSLF